MEGGGRMVKSESRISGGRVKKGPEGGGEEGEGYGAGEGSRD